MSRVFKKKKQKKDFSGGCFLENLFSGIYEGA
jgi:hypothetical protein